MSKIEKTPKENAPVKEGAPILTIAVSSRALFDFEDENKVFKSRGANSYIRAQRKKLDAGETAKPGVAFPLVKKLLSFNTQKEEQERVQVVVVSRNDPVTGLRVFHAASEYKLPIFRGCFTRGEPPFRHLHSFGAQLFLSAHAEDVKAALEADIPAAHVTGGARQAGRKDNVLRIAFDGDAVLFGDESERVYQEHDLLTFRKNELEQKDNPLSPGPFKPFLESLAALKQSLGKKSSRIRLALITARGAPAHERPIRTLMKWGLEVDEAFFLDGKSKQEVIECFGADFYFDDQVRHVRGVDGGGHVPSGVVNES